MGRPAAGRPRPVEPAQVRGVHTGRLGQRAPVEYQQEGIEEEEVATAAGIDHPRLGQHRQHVGRAGQGVGRLNAGALHHAYEIGPVRRPRRGGRGHREDGPLHGTHHGAPGQLGGVADGFDQHGGTHAGLPCGGHALTHSPQELGEDHARVPAGAHERAVADGLADLGQAGPGFDPLQLADHGFEGEGHVGARVTVGHRVDVEAVDVRLVHAQGISVAPHHGAEIVGAERRRGGHGKGC